ncbi:receptor-type tyrosine-protein phosphatase S-like [Ptychodera flava]|uniref:receptor-type tyrosine-protein phosphatase S-like n=1 Tax=Ptychodera flava TaxID=63121 RepID=UPI00396AA9CD
MRNTSVRVLALSGLFAYTKYQLLVSFRNKDQQSPWSQEYMAWTAEDVPSIPRNVTVRAGADSMTIQWLVPEPCNGLINEYKIRYWEIAKPSQNHTLIITANLGDINTATVFNLTHKAHYKVQVQASTGAGLGEFTDVLSVHTSDQIPGLPGTIGVSEVHENKISVFWTEPVVYSGDIQQYGVMYYPMESIFRHKLLKARSVLLEGNRYTYTLDELMPGTTYGIQVNASTSKGFGKPRTLKARTSFADDILKQLPLADMVKHNVEHSDTRTTVKLPGLSYDTRISKETTLIDYIIIVAYGENSAEEKLRKIDFERLGRYRTSGLTYYITASLLLKDLPSSFVVGDGRYMEALTTFPCYPERSIISFMDLEVILPGTMSITSVQIHQCHSPDITNLLVSQVQPV